MEGHIVFKIQWDRMRDGLMTIGRECNEAKARLAGLRDKQPNNQKFLRGVSITDHFLATY